MSSNAPIIALFLGQLACFGAVVCAFRELGIFVAETLDATAVACVLNDAALAAAPAQRMWIVAWRAIVEPMQDELSVARELNAESRTIDGVTGFFGVASFDEQDITLIS